MLHIQIDPHCGVPVYRQIMDQIRYYIAAGQLKRDERLPSIRELARYLHINPTTIVKAYTELQHSGEIDMRQGKGAFVTGSARTRPASELEKQFSERARALAIVAMQMGIDAARAAAILAKEIQDLSCIQITAENR